MPKPDPVSPVQSSPRGGRIQADSSMHDSAAGSGGLRQPDSATEKVAGQLRQGGAWLLDQGSEQAAQLADSGKDQLASKLNDVAEVIQSVASSGEEQYGAQVAAYVHRAGNGLSNVAEGLRTKSVDDLLTDSRSVIERHTAVAIGTAALLGFAAARIAKGGLEEQRDTSRPDPDTVDQSAAPEVMARGNSGKRHGTRKSHSAYQPPSPSTRVKDATGEVKDGAARLYGSASHRVSDAFTNSRQQVTAHPFLTVAGAAAVSAGVGWLLPAGRREHQVMSEVAHKVSDLGRDAADTAAEAGRQKVDDVTQKAFANVGEAVVQSVMGSKKSSDSGDSTSK